MRLNTLRSAALSLFVLIEVNYPILSPQSGLILFAFLGVEFTLANDPGFDTHLSLLSNKDWLKKLCHFLLAIGTVGCFAYIFVQTEPLLKNFWVDGRSLGNRAGMESIVDYTVGSIGLLLVLESARRSIGWILPALAVLFMSYSIFGSILPDWLFPHRGYTWSRIVSQVFLGSQGVFGIALRVMFTYVFLFVLFGNVLEKTGSTSYIIRLAERIFKPTTGGSAKVAVISSGVMGSLSGSAVANTATTGTFTIPMMQSAGFKPTIAAGVEAAASSGGALMPPIMGAGAYMMLELIEPSVTYLQIIKSAIVPAILYYTALLLIVHFYSHRLKHAQGSLVSDLTPSTNDAPHYQAQGWLFLLAFFILILFLILKFTPFRAVSLSLIFTLMASCISPHTRLTFHDLLDAFMKTATSATSLITAAACVGIVLGMVTQTGVGTKLPEVLLPMAEHSRLLAFALLMFSTILLGLGLPSSICYLLVATFIGPMLDQMQTPPLAAHLFIFYFGMMAMVTPPVALAAYTAGAIAKANLMRTSLAAFRFALVGFALPYAFVFNPELLLISKDGNLLKMIVKIGLTFFSMIPLATGIAGFARSELTLGLRVALVLAAFLVLVSTKIWIQMIVVGIIIGIGIIHWRSN